MNLDPFDIFALAMMVGLLAVLAAFAWMLWRDGRRR
jgi:hypothetical protein